MGDCSKDNFVNNVTNQRGYSRLNVFQCLISFFSVCTFMNSISVYFECFDFFFSFIQWSTLWLCWHCFLSTHFNTHPTLCLSHGRRHHAVETWYMPECRYWHWENNDQNVFMGWYSMVYYLSNTVCVFYFPRSWWVWLAGVFIKSLNLCNVNMNFQSRWLI